MMDMLSTNQVAEAMKINTNELDQILLRCNIHPQDGRLDAGQIAQLICELQQQSASAEARAQRNLDQVTDRYALLIDTCSLLHPCFPKLMSHLVPLLRAKGKALIIPSGVIAELQGLQAKKPELRDQIRQLTPQLAALKQEGLVTVYGSSETLGDQQLLEAAIHFMTSSELLIITQDVALSMDLIRQRELLSVRGKSMAVSRINGYGYLSRFQPDRSRFAGSCSVQSWGSRPAGASMIPEDQTLLPVDHMPVSGGSVRGADGACWILGKELASGGEGVVYDLGNGSVAKLYFPKKLTVTRRDKLELMVRTPVSCPGVCWPQELLYDHLGQLVGYRMEKAGGVILQRLFTRPALERLFPHWTKRETVQLSITILEKLSALHRQGILLGDINPRNILVESPEQVWFVDCDSYQIGGYPCSVGTCPFTAPEIQSKSYASFLRSEGNENFAIAVLLFMLMLPGKAPYAQQGSENAEEAIRAMNFPYPCGENHSENMPEGAWRYIWSHLPRYLKEDFYNTFQRGGTHSTEATRLSAEEWLRAFRSYAQLLDAGKLKDPESRKLFPGRRKARDPMDLVVVQRATCVDCGQEFEITAGERDFLDGHGWPMPRRCPLCRQFRKLENAGFSISEAM